MKIELNLLEEEVLYLQNDLLDIEKWVIDAVNGKINNCKKRMLKQWIPIMMDDPEVESIPGNESEIVKMIIKRSDYKNRLQREPIE